VLLSSQPPANCQACGQSLPSQRRATQIVHLACRTRRQMELAARRGGGRRTRQRAKTVLPERLVVALDASDVAVDSFPERPRTRGECEEGDRPCPWVACKYHLYLDVNPETGSIKLNFPDLEVWEMKETCALDIADRGGATLEVVGATMNLTRERIRQMEVRIPLRLQRQRGT